MGYTPVEYKEPINLRGFTGDKRSQKAHIVIPKKQVGNTSNDIGFERQENGEYILHISEYDIKSKTFNQTLFSQLYKKYHILQKLDISNRFRLLEQVKDKNGNIRIKLGRKI